MKFVAGGLAVVLAGWLLWTGITVHLERACVLMDTPYLPLCTDSSSNQRSTERQRQLRARLAANPGESDSWIELTHIESGKYEKALLAAVSVLAPNDPNVIMWRAGELLARRQFQEAVDLLVRLVVYRKSGVASEALARIVATGEGTPLLRSHLTTANQWLPSVLSSLAQLKLPAASALTLVAEASAKGNLSRQATQGFIRGLRDAGLWGDAYSLWLVQQRGPTPLLHNGQFDQPFQQDGFDWEVTPVPPSKAGALISQRPISNKGQVLDIQFTGRPVTLPIIRQYVFAPPGKYLLRGRYMSSKLRVDEGLAWAARCTNDKTPLLAGRSVGLEDTAGAWQSFEFPITVSPGCGLVFSLELETRAPSSAAAGVRGRAAFDALELIPQGV